MQDKKFNFSRLVLLFFQGAIIGTGAILPGISGGVLCVAFGLYEPMVGLFAHPWQSLRRNYQLFLPLFLGGGLGFLLLARVVEHLLTAAAAITLALFAGLICGTIPSLMKKSELSGPNTGWVVLLSLCHCPISCSTCWIPPPGAASNPIGAGTFSAAPYGPSA